LSSIIILLSTYNGEKHLSEQLDSILQQTAQNFKLVIRDDGSTDGTRKIIEQYHRNFPQKIEVLNDDLGNVGISKSFSLLMKSTNADFYFFADQDDIWMKSKIQEMMNINKSWDPKKPHMCFSDLIIRNEETGKRNSYLAKYNLYDAPLNKIIFSGIIHGCAMLFNHRCKLLTLELNEDSPLLHDTSIIYTTYLFGSIEIIKTPFIIHKIHETNAIGHGKKQPNFVLLKTLLKFVFNNKGYRKNLLSAYFDYVNKIEPRLDSTTRLKKGFYTQLEVDQLSYVQRKKWFLKYFNPYQGRKIDSLVKLFLV